MTPQQKFWHSPKDWPPDVDGYVFLARAVEEIRLAMSVAPVTGTEARDNPLNLAPLYAAIAHAAASGDLTMATRPLSGGPIKAGRPEWWLTEKTVWAPRFKYCQIDNARPFYGAAYGPGYSWLFVTRESLDEYLRQAAKGTAAKHDIKTERLCREWLVDQMRKSRDLPRAKNDCRDEAEEKFGVGFRAFDRAWTEAKEIADAPAWGIGGPRK